MKAIGQPGQGTLQECIDSRSRELQQSGRFFRVVFLKEEGMNGHAFPLGKFGNPAQHKFDLVRRLDRAGGIRIGPDLERFVRDELMAVTP